MSQQTIAAYLRLYIEYRRKQELGLERVNKHNYQTLLNDLPCYCY